jgi:ribosomal protein S18 acetylase RimI-like enzyme
MLEHIRSPSSYDEVDELNSFFNKNQITDELHTFTRRDNLERAFERDTRRLYYIRNDSEIVAGLMVWCESRILDESEAQIRLLATDPEYRRQGLGTKLVEEAVEFARTHNKHVAKAETSTDGVSVDFWKARDFLPHGLRTTDNGREMLMLTRGI